MSLLKNLSPGLSPVGFSGGNPTSASPVRSPLHERATGRRSSRWPRGGQFERWPWCWKINRRSASLRRLDKSGNPAEAVGTCGGFGGVLYRGSPLFIGAKVAVDISKPLKYSWTFLTRVKLLSTFVSLGDSRKGPDRVKSRMVKGEFTFQKTCLVK